MEPKRKAGIIYGLIAIAGLVFYWLLGALLDVLPRGFHWPGTVYGLILSIPMCWYLSKVTNPVTLRPKKPQSEQTVRRTMLFVVIVTPIITWISQTLLDADVIAVFAGAMFPIAIISMSYLVFLLWHHRPNR